MRRPTIQAKPKLNKPFIPAGATVVSTKTVTKEEREIQQSAPIPDHSKQAVPEQQHDNIDLGAIPFLTTADDVNGFRAMQKSKVIQRVYVVDMDISSMYLSRKKEKRVKPTPMHLYPLYSICWKIMIHINPMIMNNTKRNDENFARNKRESVSGKNVNTLHDRAHGLSLDHDPVHLILSTLGHQVLNV